MFKNNMLFVSYFEKIFCDNVDSYVFTSMRIADRLFLSFRILNTSNTTKYVNTSIRDDDYFQKDLFLNRVSSDPK